MTVTKRDYIFISYSSKDKQFVANLTRLLEEMFVKYWKAPDMIPTGSSYAKEIPKAIKACKVFLLILSANSQNSIWVEKEVDCAIYYGKEIIPLVIDEEPLSDMYRFYLNNVQMLNYFENPSQAIELLKFRLYERFQEAVDVSEPMSRQIMKTDQKPARKKAVPRKTEEVIIDESDEIENGINEANQDIKSYRENRSLELMSNRVPKVCCYCGGNLTRVGIGTFVCDSCGKENLDDFQKVREFLEKHGPCNAITIQKNTGVSRQLINELLAGDYLEIRHHKKI